MSNHASELDRLRESLRLCQEELAAVREEQEEWAEQLAPLQRAQTLLLELSTELDARLTETEQGPVPGLRGRLKNRVIAIVTPPSAKEAERVARLRATPLFDGAWYLREYPSVVASGLSPALHYLRKGARNGRNPGPDFDTIAYMRQHPRLPRRVNPLLHYLNALEARGSKKPARVATR